MKRKYLVEFGMLFCLVLGMLTGCGQKEEEARVYYRSEERRVGKECRL